MLVMRQIIQLICNEETLTARISVQLLFCRTYPHSNLHYRVESKLRGIGVGVFFFKRGWSFSQNFPYEVS